MSLDTRSFIGLTLYIAESVPATNDAAGFEALNWVLVDGLVTGPAFGVTHSAIDIPDLRTGFGKAVKGMGQGMESPMTFSAKANDAGQTLIKQLAETGGGVGSVKIGWGSAANEQLDEGDPVKYASGFFHTYQENPASADSYEGFEVTFRQNAAHILATEPA